MRLDYLHNFYNCYNNNSNNFNFVCKTGLKLLEISIVAYYWHMIGPEESCLYPIPVRYLA